MNWILYFLTGLLFGGFCLNDASNGEIGWCIIAGIISLICLFESVHIVAEGK